MLHGLACELYSLHLLHYQYLSLAPVESVEKLSKLKLLLLGNSSARNPIWREATLLDALCVVRHPSLYERDDEPSAAAHERLWYRTLAVFNSVQCFLTTGLTAKVYNKYPTGMVSLS